VWKTKEKVDGCQNNQKEHKLKNKNGHQISMIDHEMRR
jgi:hypothetical protein